MTERYTFSPDSRDGRDERIRRTQVFVQKIAIETPIQISKKLDWKRDMPPAPKDDETFSYIPSDRENTWKRAERFLGRWVARKNVANALHAEDEKEETRLKRGITPLIKNVVKVWGIGAVIALAVGVPIFASVTGAIFFFTPLFVILSFKFADIAAQILHLGLKRTRRDSKLGKWYRNQ